MLAGPARGVIWLAVVAQLVWVLWQVRLVRADWLQRLDSDARRGRDRPRDDARCQASRPRGSRARCCFPPATSRTISSSRRASGATAISRSRTTTRAAITSEYFPLDLEPHYLTRGVDGEIYSIHPVGMPVLIAPVYAAGGYRAVVVLFALMAAVGSGR